jgi:hypothetical protein
MPVAQPRRLRHSHRLGEDRRVVGWDLVWQDAGALWRGSGSRRGRGGSTFGAAILWAGSFLRALTPLAALTLPRIRTSHHGVARQGVPVEIQIRMRVLEGLAHFSVEGLSADLQVRRRSKHVQHAGLLVPARGTADVHYVRMIEPALVAGLANERHRDLPLALAVL